MHSVFFGAPVNVEQSFYWFSLMRKSAWVDGDTVTLKQSPPFHLVYSHLPQAGGDAFAKTPTIVREVRAGMTFSQRERPILWVCETWECAYKIRQRCENHTHSSQETERKYLFQVLDCQALQLPMHRYLYFSKALVWE